MTKRALIHGSRICEFVATEQDQFPVAAGLSWVEVADDTTTQDTWNGSQVVKFALTLAEAKAAKNKAIDLDREAQLAAGKAVLGKTYDARFSTMGAIVAKRDRSQRKGAPATRTITGIANTSQCTVTHVGSALENGVEVQITGCVGLTELNGNVYYVSDAAAGSFKIKDRLGNYIDSQGFGVYVSGGTATVVVTFIDKDNELVALSGDDATTVADTLSKFFNDVYEQARQYKNAVNALTTVGEVEAFDASAWPP